MDNPRQPNQEARDSGEKPESAERRTLDDATFEPESYVEQNEDFRQAESIQQAVVSLVETTQAAETVSAAAPHRPEEADRSKVSAAPGEGGSVKVDAIPITVPDVQAAADEVSSLPLPIPHPKDEASTMPVPIPSPASIEEPEEGAGVRSPAEEASVLPIPIPGEKTGPSLIPENDILPGARPSGEADTLPLPLPSPGEEIGATPITLPGKGAQPAVESTYRGTLNPRPDKAMVERDETLAGREPKIVKGIIEKASGDEGDDGGEDITPINLPNIRETVRQAEESIRQPTDSAGMKGKDAEIPAVLRQSSGQTGFKVEAEDMETVLRRQGEAAGFPKEGTGVTPTPLRQAFGETASADDTNMPVDSETGEAPITTETPDTTEQDWNPPEMYAHVGPDGKITVVDADGKPVDSPPVIQKAVDAKGMEKYVAYYPGTGETVSFELTAYTAPLEKCYALVGADGKVTVVGADGKAIDSPPVIKKIVDEKGTEKYIAYYPGTGPGEGIELGAYAAPLKGDLYVHIGPDGNAAVVGADGKPITGQPIITKTVDDKGVEHYAAHYPGGENAKVELSAYSASMEGCYALVGADGKVTIVDADGKPVDSPPTVVKVVDSNGVEKYVASYPGGEGVKAELPAYSASLEGCYAHAGPDGKVTIVDANGKPIAGQPNITKVVDANGVEKFVATYPGGLQAKVEVPAYSAPIQGCYAHAGPDGKITIVDADGKPLASQPAVTKVVDSKGMEHIVAWYPGGAGAKVPLTWYKPPSAPSKAIPA